MILKGRYIKQKKIKTKKNKTKKNGTQFDINYVPLVKWLLPSAYNAVSPVRFRHGTGFMIYLS